MQNQQSSQDVFQDFVAEYLQTGSGKDASAELHAVSSGKLFALLQTRLFSAAFALGLEDSSELDAAIVTKTIKELINNIIDESSFLKEYEAAQLRSKYVGNI